MTMRAEIRILATIAIATAIPATAFGSNQVATVTSAEGDVRIFTHPSGKGAKSPTGPGPHVLYEHEYFSVRAAAPGDRVELGNIVRTLPGARARVIFDNGDQYHVGPATAYRFSWQKDGAKGGPVLNVTYGKLRGVVSPDGPRRFLRVRTRGATMGVRGTDFFVAAGGPDGGVQFSVLRGEVEVKGDQASQAPVRVKAGFSTEVLDPKGSRADEPTKSAAEEAEKVAPPKTRKTTREELIAIQRASEKIVAATPQQEEALPEATRVRLKDLEDRALRTTAEDIRRENPKVAEAVKAEEARSLDDLNQRVVSELAKEAPKAPEKRKPYRSELEDLESGTYEKYFKQVD